MNTCSHWLYGFQAIDNTEGWHSAFTVYGEETPRVMYVVFMIGGEELCLLWSRQFLLHSRFENLAGFIDCFPVPGCSTFIFKGYGYLKFLVVEGEDTAIFRNVGDRYTSVIVYHLRIPESISSLS
jgi:hypothetical protein